MDRKIINEIKTEYILRKSLGGDKKFSLKDLAEEFSVSYEELNKIRREEDWDSLSQEVSGIVRRKIEEKILDVIAEQEKTVSEIASRLLMDRINSVTGLLPVAREKLMELIMESRSLKDVTFAMKVVIDEAKSLTDTIMKLQKECTHEEEKHDVASVHLDTPLSEIVPDELSVKFSDFDENV